MDVFLLYDGAYEDRDVVGVFETLEAAQAIEHGHTTKWESTDGERWSCKWTARHHRAKVPINVKFTTRTIPVIDGKATLPDGRIIETTAKFVDVPELPPGASFGPTVDWTSSCDKEIVRRTVVAK